MELQSQVVGRVDEGLRAQVGIDINTYDVLLHVYEAGATGARMTDLARSVLLTKAGITARVDRMATDGLLERMPDPDDRRVTRVVLTSEGQQLFRRCARVHDAVIRACFDAHLVESEAEVIADALGRAHTNNRTEK